MKLSKNSVRSVHARRFLSVIRKISEVCECFCGTLKTLDRIFYLPISTGRMGLSRRIRGAIEKANSDANLLPTDAKTVPAGEFRAQSFSISNDYCELDINIAVDKGQELYFAVMTREEYDWEMKQDGGFDPDTIFERAVGGRTVSSSIELDQGEYVIFLTPQSGSGKPSQLKGSAAISNHIFSARVASVFSILFGVIVSLFAYGYFTYIGFAIGWVIVPIILYFVGILIRKKMYNIIKPVIKSIV